MAKREYTASDVMQKIHDIVKTSGLTLQTIGERMGYPCASARSSAFGFLRAKDPRIGTVLRFAKAMEIKVKDLL